MVESTFPSVVMELSDQEIKDYFTPTDFAIGRTVIIFNRRFLIYDIDDFTKAFYWKNFNATDFTPIDITQLTNSAKPKTVSRHITKCIDKCPNPNSQALYIEHL